MMVRCYACGKELDPEWAEKISTGKSSVYVCEKCRSRGDSAVRNAKDTFYIKHSEKPVRRGR